MRCSKAIFGTLLLLMMGLPAAQADEGRAATTKSRSVSFRDEVYPLLKARCFRCHAGRESSSGYRLDQRDELLGINNGTPVIQVGQSEQSPLIARVTADDPDLRMPPKGDPLTPVEIKLLRDWIDQGVDWDERLLPSEIEGRDHWAFQPVERPPIPVPERAAWLANPVDAFIARKHEEQHLAPAARASQRTLIRRLSLDLRGIPPTPAEVENFTNDDRPMAYLQLVERYLASPEYGERWGRHWLDVARWAESEGYESNHPRPFAWRYRDYVVESFNSDKPFDEFLHQQIAGDELVPYSDENLIATGFLAAARLSSNEEDKWLQRNAVLVDVVNAVGSAFLGLTINCAQCHNHKFDPITIRDYYRLQGFFLPGQPVNAALRDSPLVEASKTRQPEDYKPALKLKEAIFEAARQRMIAEVKDKLTDEERHAVDTPCDQRSIPQELVARKVDLLFQSTPSGIERYIPDEDRKLYDELKKKIARLEKTCPPIPQTFAYYSPVTSPHSVEILPDLGFYPLPFESAEFARRRPYLQIRGDVHQIGTTLETGWPAVFDEVMTASSYSQKPRTRTDLANWLTHPEHPLTARVWVNRVWHYHFGRGIVETPGDFGLHGAAPSHPELLDWLAAELIDSGWSTKHIHRLIVESNTYQQSSAVHDPSSLERDAENRFLWHWQPRRLESEAIRDSVMAITGEMEQHIGGASVAAEDAATSRRRSVYLFQKRGGPPQMQSLFDGPREVAESCPRRHTSTTALQSLYLLNNEFAEQQAAILCEQIVQVGGGDRGKQIEIAFLHTLGRRPGGKERQAAESFFENHPAGRDDLALKHFCQALFNLNEFAYLE